MERGGDEITEHDEITRKYSTSLLYVSKSMASTQEVVTR